MPCFMIFMDVRKVAFRFTRINQVEWILNKGTNNDFFNYK
jgi:hypothetical protein